VRELGTSVDDDARVEVDGRIVRPSETRTYVVLHKPVGVMTTMRDPEGRRTVHDLVRAAGIAARVVPVGRLDYDTSGVLLLTDDGDAANVLTHPRFGVERLEEGRAAPALVRIVAVRRDVTVVDITIHEGRNRQVRRMFEVVEHPVVALVRLRFGPISLGELAPGAVRAATPRETAALHRIVAESHDAKAGQA
jgi:23S rRNA pseudouridine2605 synthase